MKHVRLLLLFITLFFIVSLQGQDTDLSLISKKIDKQLSLYPQEKLYIQIDKPVYIVGESIWFRAYLLDAFTHIPSYYSRYIYVELIDENSEVISRVKIRPDENNLHHGYIKIPENLPEGHYNLKTYTKYLFNEGEDYIYTKSIQIFAPDKKSKSVKEKKVKNYYVKFFPEGGYFLHGVWCQIAFKAVNDLGLYEDIKGELVDENGTVLAEVNSYHNGMGIFGLKAEPGKKYYLNCTNSEGKKKQFEITEALAGYYSLKVRNSQDGNLYINISKSDQVIRESSLSLLVHTGGIVQYSSPVENLSTPIVLNKKNLLSGITQILLLDAQMNPLSERLVFIQNDDQARLIVKEDKEIYKNREKIKINTKLKDQTNDPLKGSFSISVIDGNDLMPDTTSTIFTTMLLTSELKGNIENPSFYFQKNNRKANVALDILMMVHGWKRYDMAKVLKEEFVSPKIMPESSQMVSGKAENIRVFNNTLTKNGKVILLVKDVGLIEETETDDNGRFRFEGFELPDSLRYYVQALNKKGGEMVELILDEEVFPSTTYLYSHSILKPDKKVSVYKDYIDKAEEKAKWGKMKMVNLKEVRVTAKKPVRSIYALGSTRTITRDFIEKNNYTATGLESLLRRTVPGIDFGGGMVFLRGQKTFRGSSPAALIIDDVFIPQDHADINEGRLEVGSRIENLVDIYNIETIDIVYNSALLGSRAIGGAIVITTKNGKGPQSLPRPMKNTIKYTPLGYQTPVEFYSPKYETVEEKNSTTPDLRTTIYWKPDVITSDTGEAEIEFYSADATSTYYIIIEGVSENGELIYYKDTIKVDN